MKKQITNVVASTNENNKIFEAYQIIENKNRCQLRNELRLLIKNDWVTCSTGFAGHNQVKMKMVRKRVHTYSYVAQHFQKK